MPTPSPDYPALAQYLSTPRTQRPVQFLLDAALRHGLDELPEHEVGDLQTFLRAAFDLLTADQRERFYADETVCECLDISTGE